jgi:hypothetical protein
MTDEEGRVATSALSEMKVTISSLSESVVYLQRRPISSS